VLLLDLVIAKMLFDACFCCDYKSNQGKVVKLLVNEEISLAESFLLIG
jgi:hypothetical protein